MIQHHQERDRRPGTRYKAGRFNRNPREDQRLPHMYHWLNCDLMHPSQNLSSRALQPLTHRRVFAVAIPAFLSGITEPLLSLADVVIMGQLETEGLQGGVTAGSEIFVFTLWTLGFLRLSTGGFSAQAFGEQNEKKLFAVLWRGLLIAGVGGALIALMGPLFWGVLNSAMGWQPELRPALEDYLNVRVWSAPAVLFSYVCFGWLIGQQRTGLVLLLQAFINLSNIGFTWWLVLHMNMGAAGAALGSVIASYAGVALGFGILFMLGLGRRASIQSLEGFWDAQTWIRLFSTNSDFFLRSLAFAVSFMVFFKAADWLDQSQGLAGVNADAVAVLWQYLGLIVFGLDAFAVAAEAFAGEAVGAGRRERLQRASRLVFFWSWIAAGFCAVLSITLGYWALPLITKLPDVIALSRELMPYVVISGFIMAPAFMFDGLFLGGTRSREMRNSVLLGGAAQVLTTLALLPFLGIHGLWLSLVAFMVARGLYLYWRYPAFVASVPLSSSGETKAKA